MMKNKLCTFTLVFLGLCLPSTGLTKPYSLEELLDLARKGNPGLVAGARATAGIEAQLLVAKRSWMPTGELSSILAQAPRIRCYDENMNPNEYNCVRTDAVGYDASGFVNAITPRGVFTRTEIKLALPVYTFGKISAGVAAAESGVRASQSREGGLVADLELNVRRAFWGAKLARGILETLREGSRYLDQAQKKIDEELADGTGDATVTDRLRLRTVRAEVDVRILEAQRMGDLARGGLRALIGPEAPSDLDVDEAELSALDLPEHSLVEYHEAALRSRPEVKALENLVASKRALADLERRRQYPDVVLLGSAAYAYASSVDTPRNSFANNPFHSMGAGLAAGFRMPLDLGVRNAQAAKLQAEAEEADQKRREALSGISFEVEKAYTELKEAKDRMKVVQKGEKAGRQWIVAVAQNMAVGLSEARQFSDALASFFQSRIRSMQSVFDHNVAAATLARATGLGLSPASPAP